MTTRIAKEVIGEPIRRLAVSPRDERDRWLGPVDLALIGIYAQRARDAVVGERLGAIGAWLGPRVFAPASLATLGFGIAAKQNGHWPDRLWIDIGFAAFAILLFSNIAVRAPLVRRMRRGGMHPLRAARLMRSLGLVELTVLYLTVADMVAKPAGADTGTLSVGGAILAAAVLVASAAAVRGDVAGEGGTRAPPLNVAQRPRPW